MILLQALWAKVWPYLAAIGAAFAAVLAIRQSGKAAGKAEAMMEQMEADLEAGRIRNEAVTEVERLDGDDVRELARQRMRKSAKR